MGVPEYLYHYTSINSLGFILKNRTVKFNNLCDMDDAEEGRDFEIGYGKYVFVSSWTGMERETIEMWKMYSDDMRGVRIRLKSNPFDKNHGLRLMEWSDEKAKERGYIPVFADIQLKEVEYVSLEKRIHYTREEFFCEEDNKITMLIGQLGDQKNDYWEFQKEWRYKIAFVPSLKFYEMKGVAEIKPWFMNLPDLPMKQYFVPIDKVAFEDIEILLGPKTNEIDEEIVRLLVKEYNPRAKIIKSKLSNKVR